MHLAAIQQSDALVATLTIAATVVKINRPDAMRRRVGGLSRER